MCMGHHQAVNFSGLQIFQHLFPQMCSPPPQFHNPRRELIVMWAEWASCNQFEQVEGGQGGPPPTTTVHAAHVTIASHIRSPICCLHTLSRALMPADAAHSSGEPVCGPGQLSGLGFSVHGSSDCRTPRTVPILMQHTDSFLLSVLPPAPALSAP